ncbi:hypothetical protein BH10PSE14_BH10PSE14_27440 [soil metagenome]
MLAFQAETEDMSFDVVIFAENFDDAAAKFFDVYLAEFEEMPGEFSIGRRALCREHNKAALREAMARNVTGLGVLNGGIWTITPIPVMTAPPPKDIET